MRRAITAAILPACLALGLGAAEVAAHNQAEKQLTGKPDWGGEGSLLLAPKDGPDRNVTRYVEPGVMSIVFSQRHVAEEFYDEAASNGERVCLADLGPQPAERRGMRWWLFTC